MKKNELLVKTFNENLSSKKNEEVDSLKENFGILNKISANYQNLQRSKSLTKIEKEPKEIQINYQFRTQNINPQNQIRSNISSSSSKNLEQFTSRSKSSYFSTKSNSAYFRTNHYGMSLKQYSQNFFSRSRCNSVEPQSEKTLIFQAGN